MSYRFRLNVVAMKAFDLLVGTENFKNVGQGR